MKALLILGFAVAVIGGAGLSTQRTTASSAGTITNVCLQNSTVEITVDAIGDFDDGGGLDEIGASLDAPSYADIKWTDIPANGQFHTAVFQFDVSGVDLSQGVAVCAGDGDGNQNAIGPGFYGCGTVSQLPNCTYQAEPVPPGYVQHRVVCDTPVFDANGEPVPDTLVTSGQTWYMAPDATGEWTGIFVAGADPVYIPSTCVGPRTE